MPVYQVGIDISIAKSTTVLVRLEAENKEEAYDKAWNKIRNISCDRKKTIGFLKRVQSYHWEEDYSSFTIEGNSRDDYPIEHYEADLDLTKEG